jgi:hypothetical protein
MAGKIFYRERSKVGEGVKQPQFRVIAVAGTDVRIDGTHLRKTELEQIAAAVGAELVLLERGDKERKKDKKKE